MVFPILIWIQGLLNLLVPYNHPTLQSMDTTQSWTTLIVLALGTVVVAPITEEIFFRMFLLGWLQRLMPGDTPEHRFVTVYGNNAKLPESTLVAEDARADRGTSRWIQPGRHLMAILIASLLFGMAHYGQGLAPVTLFLLAVALGYLYQRTGSAVGPIVAHLLLNFYSIIWKLLSAT